MPLTNIPPPHIVSEKPLCGSVLTCFHRIILLQKNMSVKLLMQGMSPKTYDLNPFQLHKCIDEMVPVLTDAVNDCHSTGSVPDSSKRA